MPPPSNHPSLYLQVQPGSFFVIKLPSDEGIPPWVLEELASTKSFFSVTRTTEEISIVGESHETIPEHSKEFSTWTCIKIMGPMEHDLTGIMASFTAPLKEAKVPIIAMSTWNTDYILVPTKQVTSATAVLKSDGWTFV
ncbi:putative ACT domain containing protein [Lyophyllum shimeji]|uniref:ACT domain containing protein n=1 Tax=Lyophyllum shimeji TaxID=47721 RepID=A0A9P3PGW6_LYOSH|nr:putative ACT domain containing protein [Lyophyllum shimeji]